MMFGIAMPDWRDGVIAVVKADGSLAEALGHIMRSCGVSTLSPASLPKYKISCIETLLGRYRYVSTAYITDIYGTVNRAALKMGISRAALFEKAWSYLSSLICDNIKDAECDEEVKLTCCGRPCGGLCELAKFEAYMRRGVVVDLTNSLKKALGVPQDL